jgi:hypothetical protein
MSPEDTHIAVCGHMCSGMRTLETQQYEDGSCGSDAPALQVYIVVCNAGSRVCRLQSLCTGFETGKEKYEAVRQHTNREVR